MNEKAIGKTLRKIIKSYQAEHGVCPFPGCGCIECLASQALAELSKQPEARELTTIEFREKTSEDSHWVDVKYNGRDYHYQEFGELICTVIDNQKAHIDGLEANVKGLEAGAFNANDESMMQDDRIKELKGENEELKNYIESRQSTSEYEEGQANANATIRAEIKRLKKAMSEIGGISNLGQGPDTKSFEGMIVRLNRIWQIAWDLSKP